MIGGSVVQVKEVWIKCLYIEAQLLFLKNHSFYTSKLFFAANIYVQMYLLFWWNFKELFL